jgi:hypothetical protein
VSLEVDAIAAGGAAVKVPERLFVDLLGEHHRDRNRSRCTAGRSGRRWGTRRLKRLRPVQTVPVPIRLSPRRGS